MTKQERIENMRVLGMTFLLLAKSDPKSEVDMDKPYFDHQCGTVACHAGWFAIARGLSVSLGTYNFLNSANDLAKFIGFRYRDDLTYWASVFPTIWGNQFGHRMFLAELAFGMPIGKQPTLKDIGLHWLGVADRYEASELE